MKLGKFDDIPFSRRKPEKPTPPTRAAKGSRSDFIKACEAAGKNPHTVRRRMKPKHQRGQGMTLEEALAAPVMTRSEAGARNRTNRRKS